MDWLRSAIGITPATVATKKPKSNAVRERYEREAATTSYDERVEKFARAQAIKLQMKEMELNETRELCKQAVATRNDAEAKRHMMRVKQLQGEINTLRAKHQNVTQTSQSISTANQNLAQALLVKDAAEELEQSVAAMEEIDLDAAVDKLQDGVAEVNVHDSRLSEPIFGHDVVLEDEVDDELARMMRERDERDAARYDLPDAFVPQAEVGQVKNGATEPEKIKK